MDDDIIFEFDSSVLVSDEENDIANLLSVEDYIPQGVLESTPERVAIEIMYNGKLREFELKDVCVYFTDGNRVERSNPVEKAIVKATLYLTRSFTHSEIAFRFETEPDNGQYYVTYAACAIYAGEMLEWYWQTKNYSQPMWRACALNLTSHQRYRVFEACRRDVAIRKPFNNWVYVNFLLPRFLQRNKNGKEVWCSEHGCYVLREAGVKEFADVEPWRMDPLEFYSKLKGLETAIEVNPMVMNRIEKKGLVNPITGERKKKEKQSPD